MTEFAARMDRTVVLQMRSAEALAAMPAGTGTAPPTPRRLRLKTSCTTLDVPEPSARDRVRVQPGWTGKRASTFVARPRHRP